MTEKPAAPGETWSGILASAFEYLVDSGQSSPEDERRFATAMKVSDINLANYRSMASGAVATLRADARRRQAATAA